VKVELPKQLPSRLTSGKDRKRQQHTVAVTIG
jgi:hypothetical protein